MRTKELTNEQGFVFICKKCGSMAVTGDESGWGGGSVDCICCGNSETLVPGEDNAHFEKNPLIIFLGKVIFWIIRRL